MNMLARRTALVLFMSANNRMIVSTLGAVRYSTYTLSPTTFSPLPLPQRSSEYSTGNHSLAVRLRQRRSCCN